MTDLVVRNGRVVIPEAGILQADLEIAGGRITALRPPGSAAAPAGRIVDAAGRYVLPGLLDPHTHPGWFPPVARHLDTESAALALGGVTTLFGFLRQTESYLDFVPPMIAAATAVVRQDFTFHLTLFTARQLAEIPDCVERLDITSFKIYMSVRGPLGRHVLMDSPPGRLEPTYGQAEYDDGYLAAAIGTLANLPVRCRLLVHAENADALLAATAAARQQGLDGLLGWHVARPAIGEALAIDTVCALARQLRVPVYFPHIGSRAAIAAVDRGRRSGANVVAETCPHYLVETTESAVGTLLRVNPPIRPEEDRQATWAALAGGILNVIGTDHVALTQAEKRPGSIWTAESGFPGAGVALPLLITHGVLPGRLSIRQLTQITSCNTARAFGLYPRKGTLLPGSDADLVIVDLDTERPVQAQRLGSRSDFSPYEGRRLRGWPWAVLRRGEIIVAEHQLVAAAGGGQFLRRGA